MDMKLDDVRALAQRIFTAALAEEKTTKVFRHGEADETHETSLTSGDDNTNAELADWAIDAAYTFASVWNTRLQGDLSQALQAAPAVGVVMHSGAPGPSSRKSSNGG